MTEYKAHTRVCSTKKTDGIILYRTKRRDGITKDHLARQDQTGLREQMGLGNMHRTDNIRQEHQDKWDQTRSLEHAGFDRTNWTDGVRCG
jgi:hypothetical protein